MTHENATTRPISKSNSIPRAPRSPRGPVVSAVDDLDHRSPNLQLHLHTPTSTNHEPAQTPRLDQDSTPVSYRLVRHAVSRHQSLDQSRTYYEYAERKPRTEIERGRNS